MTKEIHDINTKVLDFVVELIEYIFEYPDDDYMTMECLCRKLYKYGLVDKKDGYYLVADDVLHKEESQKNCYTCRHLRVCDIRDTTNELCRYESRYDPQTCSVSGRPYSECSSCEYFRCVADEPQIDCNKCETYWNCQGQCDEIPQIEDEWLIEKEEIQMDKVIGCSKCVNRFWCTDRDMSHAIHCNNYGKSEDEQTEYDKGLQLFADILFDKKKREQFLKECKDIGIEP